MKLLFTLYDFYKKIKQDKINMYAAQSSFFIIVSFFPFIMLLFCLLNYTAIKESYLLTIIYDVFPAKTQPLIISIISELYSSSSFTLLSVTAVSAIWAAGKGFVSLIQGLNDIYNTGGETRNYFVLRFYSVFYTIVLMALIIVTLLLMVFGNRILNFINLWWPIIGVITEFLLRFKVLIFISMLTAFFLLVYRFVPNRKSRLTRELPGAVFSSVGWVIFSYVFSLYVDMSAGFSVTYGSLATLVFIMLWLYFCINILFIGGEINAFLQKS